MIPSQSHTACYIVDTIVYKGNEKYVYKKKTSCAPFWCACEYHANESPCAAAHQAVTISWVWTHIQIEVGGNGSNSLVRDSGEHRFFVLCVCGMRCDGLLLVLVCVLAECVGYNWKQRRNELFFPTIQTLAGWHSRVFVFHSNFCCYYVFQLRLGQLWTRRAWTVDRKRKTMRRLPVRKTKIFQKAFDLFNFHFEWISVNKWAGPPNFGSSKQIKKAQHVLYNESFRFFLEGI